MLTLVIGGSASGKSAFAERLAVQSGLPRFYVATMRVWDAESERRVARHRDMRREKRFDTLECPIGLDRLILPARGTALLEDMGNLVANELYDADGAGRDAVEAAVRGVERLHRQCAHLIVVSNEVFRGGADYAGDTARYLLALARVNNAVAARTDHVWRRSQPGETLVLLETIGVAFAMFSALPVPRIDWNERNMRYAMAAFPLIGAVIGTLWCVCGALPLPDMLRAAGFCLIPVAVTGGIHLDGYADTSDALSSYGDREKKLDILKDPHCGAFAVIRLCSYFTLYFALCACVRFTPRVGLIWLLALVLERCLSGYAVAAFPMAKNTGLAHTFATAADRRRVKAALLTMSVCVGGGMACMGGGLLVLAALAALWRYRAVAVKQFGGVTGDLAGWFLQRAELWMLAALLLSGRWLG